MYRAYGLLQPASDFTVDEAFARMRAKFPQYAVTRNGDQVTVSKGDWELELMLNAADYVTEENNGLTGKLAGLEQDEAAGIVASGKRVEVWSDTPDPHLEHFADFQAMVEVLKSFRGLTAVDPNEPGVL